MAARRGVRSAIAWLLLIVTLSLFLRHGSYGGLLTTIYLFALGWRRFGEPLHTLCKPQAVISWKWTLLLIVLYSLVLIGAGHGVLPLGVLLVFGWSRFLAPVLLGWLGIALLGASPFLRWTFAPALATIGVLLLVGSCVLVQTFADDSALAIVGSLPFLAGLVIYAIHLSRVRPVTVVRA